MIAWLNYKLCLGRNHNNWYMYTLFIRLDKRNFDIKCTIIIIVI